MAAAAVLAQSQAPDLVQEVEDFAPHPTLTQSFPVVAPLSDLRHGHKDLPSPEEVFAKLVADEEKHDAWRFRRERAQAALLREQRLVSVLTIRSEEAERAADAAAALAADRAVDLEFAREQRIRRGDVNVRDLRKRLDMARENLGEVEADCQRRLQEARELLEQERAHTAVVEALLAEERLRSEEGRRRIAEAEALAASRVERRAKEAEDERAEGLKRLADEQALGNARIKAAKEKGKATLKLMRDQLHAQKERCAGDVELEENRKAEALNEAERRLVTATQRLGVEQGCARQCTVSTAVDCEEHVKRVQHREEYTRAFVDEWQRGSVALLFETAAAKSQAAHRREMLAKHSLENTVHILGTHYSTHRQYNVTVDGRLSGVLGGCLHAEAAPGPHSPRSLPPPNDGLPTATFRM